MKVSVRFKKLVGFVLPLSFMMIASSINTNAASSKNDIYSTKKTNFKNNIDNFLTANTMYRPKMINENGTHWRKSKNGELRPLITVWWPNKATQVNYIYFMKNSKYNLAKGIDHTTLYDNNSSQSELNKASKVIQKNIEKRIYKTKSTTWLNKLVNKFINTQSQWNIKSENYSDGSLPNGIQGGLLTYENSKLTPWANSTYRLFNRNGFNQSGDNDKPGAELLLANDIDNSNPTVQSEQLNLLHYLTHFGSITQKNKNANFDSVRIDASLNMDQDLMDITSSYFQNAFKVTNNEYNANNHLSISEVYANAMPDPDRLVISNNGMSSLTSKPDKRTNISDLKYNKDDYKNNPTYSYLNAHDGSDANSVFLDLIPKNTKMSKREINNKINEAAYKYNQDRKSTNKKSTQYNVPSAYSLILTNKNTVPRIYYGDLYNDTDVFMKEKTPYYKAITALMKDRKKYVSGSENKQIQNLSNTENNDSNNHQVLTSIREGKTKTQGMAVVLSNNPKLTLSNTDKVKVSMGSNHKNQKFRPALKSNNNGISVFNSDKSIKNNDIKTTDGNGDFYLDKNDIAGVSNPQVSGYLSTWVPMGAKQNQDARTKSSKNRVEPGKYIYQGDALDSNLIIEGFSSYIKQEKNPSTYRKIAKNAKLFNQLGITYYELPPTYRSSKGNSFQDETFESGYAIKDRYDYGFKTPTKYGTAKELTNAINSLHKNNVKAMADYVPNQVYKLPKKQIVNVTRTDWSGNYIGDNAIKNKLYATNSKGSGKDYQAKFGGKYLKELKTKYPSIFTQKQISTGKTIDNSGKRIKTWSAKYLNGTNIQGRGSDYVLSNNSNGKYYKVGKNQYLPKNLLK